MTGAGVGWGRGCKQKTGWLPAAFAVTFLRSLGAERQGSPCSSILASVRRAASYVIWVLRRRCEQAPHILSPFRASLSTGSIRSAHPAPQIPAVYRGQPQGMSGGGERPTAW